MLYVSEAELRFVHPVERGLSTRTRKFPGIWSQNFPIGLETQSAPFMKATEGVLLAGAK
jgi:hypothetical protein